MPSVSTQDHVRSIVLQIGTTAQVKLIVEPHQTAATYARDEGESYPAVLATPVMIAEMERACAALLRPLLKGDELSVGVRVEVEHQAPTPVGSEIVTTASFTGQADPLFWFEVRAEDPAGPIGRGRHARAIVKRTHIEKRAAARGVAREVSRNG